MAADILVVDDEQDIRDLVAGILEDEGKRSAAACHGSDSFEEFWHMFIYCSADLINSKRN